MTKVDRLLSVARAEIGVAEEPIGSNSIKYNADYYGRAVSGAAYAWCMVFVWWCFKTAGLSELFFDGGRTASCTALMRWAQREGRFFMGGYKAGDVMLYQLDEDDMAEHTGIYTGQVDGRGRYLVIEGNHDDRVEIVARSDAELWGAWRPEWEETQDGHEGERIAESPSALSNDEEKRAADWGIDLPDLRYGDQGSVVKAMQILLMGWGYQLPKYGADGEYGAETRKALKAFQGDRGLRADGVSGPETWKKLLGV